MSKSLSLPDTAAPVKLIPSLHVRSLEFEGRRINEACWINGEPHFTRRAIGEWLEYKFPVQAVTQIVERNPHIREFSTVIKLTSTDEYPKRRDSVANLATESPTTLRAREIKMEVYNPIGLQLIIFKSSKPKAVAYQVWAARLVKAYMEGRLKSPPPPPGTSLALLHEAAAIPAGVKSPERAALVREVVSMTGRSRTTAYRDIRSVRAGGAPAVKRRPGPRPGTFRAVSAGEQRRIRRWFDADPAISAVECWRRLGSPGRNPCYSTVYRFLKTLAAKRAAGVYSPPSSAAPAASQVKR